VSRPTPHVEPSPDFRELREDVIQANPFIYEGVTIWPSSDFVIGTGIGANGACHVILTMKDSLSGFSRTLSAEQAQLAGESLIRLAGQISDAAAGLASEAIDRARGGAAK
jgi:hypothetical protein